MTAPAVLGLSIDRTVNHVAFDDCQARGRKWIFSGGRRSPRPFAPRLLREREPMRPLFMGVLLGAGTAIAFQQVRRRMAVNTQHPAASGAAAPPPAARHDHARTADVDELGSLTAAELYQRAQAAGIRGRAAMTKAQLIDALRAASQ